MGRPKIRETDWPMVGVRLEPSLMRAVRVHLGDPMYVKLPPGAIQTFINAAVANELTRLGKPCSIPSSDSTTPSGTIPEPEPF